MSISLKEPLPMLSNREAIMQTFSAAQFTLLLDYKGNLWMWSEELGAKLKRISGDENDKIVCFDCCAQKTTAELIVLGFESGAVEFINASGTSQKKVKDAHKGSIVCIAFSPDYQTIISSSEDCVLKLWSRAGMLRSELSKIEAPSYAVSWAPDSSHVAYGNGKDMVVKSIRPGTNDLTVKCTEVGVLLVLSWSRTENLVIVAGEDCRYSLVDTAGHSHFVSAPFDTPFTCGVWSALSGVFVLSSHCEILLGDKSGKVLNRVPLRTPALTFCLATDSNRLTIGLQDGSVQTGVAILFGTYKYKNFELRAVNECNIVVSDIHSDYTAKLDFGSAAVTAVAGFGDRIVVTAGTKCHLYDTKNFITPTIFELPLELVLFTSLAPNYAYFALSSGQTRIVSFDLHGKQIGTVKLPFQSVNQRLFSASWETMACVDAANPRVCQFYDAVTGKETTVYRHANDIQRIGLNYSRGVKSRKLAFCDANKDLWVVCLATGVGKRVAAMANSFIWHETLDLLAYSASNRLSVLYSPNALAHDAKLIANATVHENIAGRCELTEFNDCQLCSINERNVSLIHQINSFALRLIRAITEGTNAETTNHACIRLARFFKSNLAWAILAVHALDTKDTDTSEVCLAALNEVDKVQALSRINSTEDKELAQLELLRFQGRLNECEKLYIAKKQYLQAVKLYVSAFDFKRAYELAKQLKTASSDCDWLVDYVLHKRRKYIRNVGFSDEIDDFFGNLNPRFSAEEVKQKKAAAK